MFCKYCGKKIAEDSVFCQYCGGKMDLISQEDESHQVNDKDTTVENEEPIETKGAKEVKSVIIETKEEKPIQVELSKKKNDKKSTIANEIVANIKMLGWAALLFAVYMIGFIIYHGKDVKEFDCLKDESYFGESCYDPSVIYNFNWMLHWEEHYYGLLCYTLEKEVSRRTSMSLEDTKKRIEELEKQIVEKKKLLQRKYNLPDKISDEDFLKYYGMLGVVNYHIYKTDLEQLKKEAKQNAKKDIEGWNNEINSYRKDGYKEDLKKNALYAAIISILIMVLGRYIIKSAKWVNTNKSK